MVNPTRLQRVARRVDRSVRPFSYCVFAAALVVEAWVFFYVSREAQELYLLPLTILLSAIMATCAWMWSGHINRRLSRKSQALALLLAVRSQEVNSWKHEVYEYIRKLDLSEPSDPPVESIEKLLGFYETIAISVMNGTSDEDMIKESQRFVFLRIFQGLRQYIENRQKSHAGLYVHFVHYAIDWNEGTPHFSPTYVKTDREFL